MSAADETALNSELEELRDNRSVFAKGWDACKRMPLGAFGAFVAVSYTHLTLPPIYSE